MEKYDVCIIGAGPSGYAAAMRAVDFGKKVALIERAEIGGAGVTNGALSSKTWWELSRNVDRVINNKSRYNLSSPTLNFDQLKNEVASAVSDRKELLISHIDQINAHSNGVGTINMIKGEAHLKTKNLVSIDTRSGTEEIEADYILLATGSRPRKLPNIPIDQDIIMTSDGIVNLKEFPKSMVILGAGVIGCEFATIFSSMKCTKVHLIDKGDRILPFEDEDVVKVIERNMEANDILIHRNSHMIRMEIVDGQVEYELEYSDGKKEIFHVEKALVSVGRVPNYENLGLEEIGVNMDARGIIDQDTKTSIDNIYAAGDITADIALVNVGELEGRHAIERMFGKPKRAMVYENISTIMFLKPEVAGVGLNEIQARQKGISYRVAKVDYSVIPRAVAQRNTQGFVKMLVTDDDEMKIIGLRVVGNHASSAIQAIALLISMDKGIEEIAECVHPHPSIPEGIQECVRLFLGKSTFKPFALDNLLHCEVYNSTDNAGG